MARQNKEMKVRNENRPGYKKTRVGWIPEEWDIQLFSQVADLTRGPFGGTLKKEMFVKEGYKVYEQKHAIYSDFTAGSYFIDKEKFNKLIRFSLKPGDLIMSCSGTAGKISIFPETALPGVINQALLKISSRKHVSLTYLFTYLNSKYFQSYLFTDLAGGAMKNIAGMPAIKKIPIIIPPLIEQIEIADRLSIWDKAITQTQNLINSKTKLKKGLMQKLVSASASANKGKWEKIRLSQVTRQSSERNTNGLSKDCIMAVTKQSGLIPMKKEKIGNNINRYKIVRQNWFAYNPMRVNIGSIARWEKSNVVMVSPDYVVFSADETQLCPEYLDHFRHSHEWKSYLYAAGSGSVRTRIYYKDLARMKFRLPPIHEQKKIIHILNLCETEITQLTKQKSALEKQKKGLMQKLLTGEIRV